jgi:hypothetical protein
LRNLSSSENVNIARAAQGPNFPCKTISHSPFSHNHLAPTQANSYHFPKQIGHALLVSYFILTDLLPSQHHLMQGLPDVKLH